MRRAQQPEGVTLAIADLSEVPLFDEDLEARGLPASVGRLRQRAAEADGLLIASPEYDYGMTGAPKNAVDWFSRPDRSVTPRADGASPEGATHPVPPKPLVNKPVVVMGASAGLGGTIRSQSALRQARQLDAALAMPRPEVSVTSAHAKFDRETGDLRDEETSGHVRGLLDAFAAWIERMRDDAPRPVAQAPSRRAPRDGGGRGGMRPGSRHLIRSTPRAVRSAASSARPPRRRAPCRARSWPWPRARARASGPGRADALGSSFSHFPSRGRT